MSTTTKNNSNSVDTAAAISEAEDMKMFQAARRNGRRNALGDLSEHLSQGNPSNLHHSHLSFFHSSQCFKFYIRRR